MREKVNPSGLLTITQRALLGAGNTRKSKWSFEELRKRWISARGSPHPPAPSPTAPSPTPTHTQLQRTLATSADIFGSHLWRRCGWRVVGGGWGRQETRCTAQDSPEKRALHAQTSAALTRRSPDRGTARKPAHLRPPCTRTRERAPGQTHKPSARASEKAQLTARLSGIA